VEEGLGVGVKSRLGRTAVVSAAGALFFLGTLAIPETSYAATTIQSEKAEAAQISASITQYDNELQVDAAKYDYTETEIQTTDAKISQAAAKIASQRSHLVALRRRLEAEAVSDFMQAGSNSQVLALVQGSVDSAAIIEEDVHAASADQQAIVSQYKGALVTLSSDERTLETQRSSLQGLSATLVSERNQAQAAQSAAQSQLSQVNSQIAQLVAQAQEAALKAREAAAAAALAAQQAQAAKEAQEAQAAQAQAGTLAVPVADAAGGTGTPTALGQEVAQAAIAMAQKDDSIYVWGGAGQWIPNSPSYEANQSYSTVQEFDCSGLVQYLFAEFGVSLPHNAAMQASMSTPILYTQLEPGDLVFYHTLGANYIDHVAIYVGNGEVVEATNPPRPVSLDPITWSGTPWSYGQIN